MKKGIVIFLVLASLLISPCINHGEDYSNSNYDYAIDMRVDPTIELFCTIHRLANTDQYTTNEFPLYISDIEEYFEKFRNHAAVRLAIQQRNQNRINGSAPITCSVFKFTPSANIKIFQTRLNTTRFISMKYY